MIAFENKPEIGKGIYTLKDVASILKIPYPKVRRWVKTYWDGRLGNKLQQHYSWKIDGSIAVSFHTVVELYVMIQFAEIGVKTQDVLIAHEELSELLNTPFPFAQKEVLDEVKTDGKTVFWKFDGALVSMNGTRQINLDIIQVFFKKLEFEEDVVSRLWPMGKDHAIVIDPKRKFGHPILDGRNIYPETLYGYYQAGDSIQFIAYIFEITEKEVLDAIDFCEAA
jgi:uncharacterized protein (DUF433 family)